MAGGTYRAQVDSMAQPARVIVVGGSACLSRLSPQIASPEAQARGLDTLRNIGCASSSSSALPHHSGPNL